MSVVEETQLRRRAVIGDERRAASGERVAAATAAVDGGDSDAGVTRIERCVVWRASRGTAGTLM